MENCRYYLLLGMPSKFLVSAGPRFFQKRLQEGKSSPKQLGIVYF